MTRAQWVRLFVFGGLLCLGVWYAIAQIPIHADLADLLPKGATETQQILMREIRAGLAGRLTLVAIEGPDPDRLATISLQLGDRLRGNELVDYVGNGRQQWTPREQDVLFQARYLLSPDIRPEIFEAPALRMALEQRLDELRSPLAPMLKPYLQSDPTGELTKILKSWAGWSAPAKYKDVWFSGDLKRALLVVETKAAGFDTDAQAAAQRTLSAEFESIQRDVQGHSRLVMSGPGVIAVNVQQMIEAEAWRLSIIAAGVIVLFLYLCYGSVILVGLSIIPLTSGVLAGMFAVHALFGFVHGITLGFGVTLLGVVDDYPIHLFSHLTGKRPPPTVMRDIWPTMRVGVLTTAIGFSALLLAGFPGLSQLGVFSITGLLAAAAVTRWVLPFLVPAGFAPTRTGAGLSKVVDRLTHARWVVPISMGLAVLFLVGSSAPFWERDIENLTPISVEQKTLDQTLRNELGVPDVRDLLMVQGMTDEDVLIQSEGVAIAMDRLIDERALASYDIVTRYLPSRRTQRARQRLLADRPALEHALNTAREGLPFKPDAFTVFLDAIDTAKTLPPIEYPTLQGTALGLKVNALLSERQGLWIAIVPLRGVTDRAQLRAAIATFDPTSVVYLDIKEESNGLVSAYRHRTVMLAGLGIVFIGVLLLLDMRNPVKVLRVLLPIGCAILVVSACLHALGERLSLFHIASFLLVVGLGLDYALFFNRRHGTEMERDRTIYGLLVCSTTTILVFGILMTSHVPILRAIGLTAGLGSLCCMLFGAILAERTSLGSSIR